MGTSSTPSASNSSSSASKMEPDASEDVFECPDTLNIVASVSGVADVVAAARCRRLLGLCREGGVCGGITLWECDMEEEPGSPDWKELEGPADTNNSSLKSVETKVELGAAALGGAGGDEEPVVAIALSFFPLFRASLSGSFPLLLRSFERELFVWPLLVS